MKPHVRNYFKAFNYDESSVILCEVCGAVAIDIHHVLGRWKFGKKQKGEQDDVTNLVALCRSCHDKAHGDYTKVYRQMCEEIISKR